MTKDEAQEKVKSTRRNRKNIFCPIIQNSCRENCECYSEKIFSVLLFKIHAEKIANVIAKKYGESPMIIWAILIINILQGVITILYGDRWNEN